MVVVGVLCAVIIVISVLYSKKGGFKRKSASEEQK